MHIAHTPARWLACAALVAACLSACSDDDAAQPATAAPQDAGHDAPDDAAPDTPDAAVDAAVDVDDDAAVDAVDDADAAPFVPETLDDGVVQTLVLVPAPAPPANPVTGASSPPETNLARYVRYTLDGGPAEREGILVLMPGFLGGAGSFDPLARAVVLQSEGRFEVWAIDRRSNALEDLRGVAEAEARKDPSLATAYYYEGAALGGERFAGIAPQADLSYMSEWGLKTHMDDLRAVLATVPEALRAKHVFLGGHSLGASLVQIYAAQRFDDGHAGHDDLAGLIVLDGAVRAAAPDAAPLTEDAYLGGFSGGPFGVTPGLDDLRDRGDVTVRIPFIEPSLFALVEIAGLRASRYTGDPDGSTPDPRVDQFFNLLLSGSKPTATHTATLGFAFDTDFQPLGFFNTNLGTAQGGLLEPTTSLFAPGRDLLKPSDPDAFYTWTSDGLPSEPTDVQDLALALYAGPSNFAEWYFPARLTLDVAALGDLTAPPAWAAAYGIDAAAVAEVDVPVLALGGSDGLLPDAALYDHYRSLIAPTTRAGLSRDDPAGWRTVVLDRYAHLDLTLSRDPALSGLLLDWMRATTAGATFPAPTP